MELFKGKVVIMMDCKADELDLSFRAVKTKTLLVVQRYIFDPVANNFSGEWLWMNLKTFPAEQFIEAVNYAFVAFEDALDFEASKQPLGFRYQDSVLISVDAPAQQPRCEQCLAINPLYNKDKRCVACLWPKEEEFEA